MTKFISTRPSALNVTAQLSAVLAWLILLTGCNSDPNHAESPRLAQIAAQEAVSSADTAPPLISPAAIAAAGAGAATGGAFVSLEDSGDPVMFIGATGSAGLQIYAIDGSLQGAHDGIETSLVEVLPDFDGPTPMLLVYDAGDASLKPFVLDASGRQLNSVPGETIQLEDELVGMCSYRSALSNSWSLFGVTDEGLTLQWEIYGDNGRLGARFLRSIPTGKGSGYCAVDPRDGTLYISDEELGVWSLGAEPESDTTRQIVDVREPWGRLGDEIKGTGVYQVSDTLSYLLLADAAAGLLRVYALPGGDYLGGVTVDGLSQPEGLAIMREGDSGWVAIADEDESDGATDYKLLAWKDIAALLALETNAGPLAAAEAIATVTPRVETQPVASYGDAADDPAIWVHPEDPALSLVIGTQKQRGLHVYDLEGNELQFLPDGRINNVDLRDGFSLGGNSVSLLAASNRTHDSISLYIVDVESRRLIHVSDGIVSAEMNDPYGLCMYHNPDSDEFYAFVNDSSDGRFVQFRLFESSPGLVSAEVVREFVVGTQSEGCVADDASGTLYVAEEDFGIYRYGAEPDSGDARTLVETVESGRLTADVEGLALWALEDGTGYLVVSNQGVNNFVLYRREGENEYVGTFHVVANPARGFDGVSETDGLEVTSTPLGEAFPRGLMVAQDGRNIAPAERQNFKYVSWADIAEALDLDP